MQFVDASEARSLQAAAALANGNPFLPERIEYEKRCLGAAFVPSAPVWHADAELPRPNLPLLRERLEALLSTLRGRLADGARATREQLVAYEGLVRHVLYMRYEDVWSELIETSEGGGRSTGRVRAYREFAQDVAHCCDIDGVSLPARSTAPPRSPGDSRSVGSSTTPIAASTAAPCRPRGCAPRCGSRSSPTT